METSQNKLESYPRMKKKNTVGITKKASAEEELNASISIQRKCVLNFGARENVPRVTNVQKDILFKFALIT